MILQSCTSSSGKKFAFTLFDAFYRSAHACNLLKIYKYGKKKKKGLASKAKLLPNLYP